MYVMFYMYKSLNIVHCTTHKKKRYNLNILLCKPYDICQNIQLIKTPYDMNCIWTTCNELFFEVVYAENMFLYLISSITPLKLSGKVYKEIEKKGNGLAFHLFGLIRKNRILDHFCLDVNYRRIGNGWITSY